MDVYTIIQTIIDNLAAPILIAIGGAIALLINKWADKIGNSVTVKNEIESIEKRMKTRKDILDTLAPTVEAAVASNMQLANTVKERNGKLSEEDVLMLNESAKKLVFNTLPKSLTEEDGVLLDIIGGPEQLDAAITVMIERYVYEYKLKMASTSKENSSNKNRSVMYPINKNFFNNK